MWGMHLLIYCIIFAIISYVFIEITDKIKYRFIRGSVIAITLSILIYSSFLPIYSRCAPNGNCHTANILGVYKLAGRVSSLPW